MYLVSSWPPRNDLHRILALSPTAYIFKVAASSAHHSMPSVKRFGTQRFLPCLVSIGHHVGNTAFCRPMNRVGFQPEGAHQRRPHGGAIEILPFDSRGCHCLFGKKIHNRLVPGVSPRTLPKTGHSSRTKEKQPLLLVKGVWEISPVGPVAMLPIPSHEL